MTSAPTITKESHSFASYDDIATLLPEQGAWSEAEYLWLSGRTNRLVEFVDGYLEVLPMPTDYHQRIVLFYTGCSTVWLIGDKSGLC